jgi:hypothetical protein
MAAGTAGAARVTAPGSATDIRSGSAADIRSGSASASAPGAVESLRPPAPIARLHVGATGSLFAIAATGEVWEHAGARWRPIGTDADPTVEPASGHGRLVTRGRDGRLWVSESGRSGSTDGPPLAPHAGLLALAGAVIGVTVEDRARHVLLRMEPDGRGRWRETARGADALLPDARPVLWNPAGTASDADADIAVLGGPDATRYRHAVLGDDVEATTLFRLRRHGLAVRGRLDLPAPYVFEDIAPRPIAWRGGRALLTVRAGPLGGQLAVVAAAAGSGGDPAFDAFGPPIGQRHRWLAPTTDGTRILAVHTPHIGGVLHRYRVGAEGLVGEVMARGVSNHALGSRDLDVSAWLDDTLVIPTQAGDGVRVLEVDRGRDGGALREIRLGATVVTLHRWIRAGTPVAVALLSGGDVVSIRATP